MTTKLYVDNRSNYDPWNAETLSNGYTEQGEFQYSQSARFRYRVSDDTWVVGSVLSSTLILPSSSIL